MFVGGVFAEDLLTTTVTASPETNQKLLKEYDGAKATAAADDLYSYNLFKGVGDDEEGNPVYALDREVTRIEALVMLVRLLGKEEDALQCKESYPFIDVPDWAASYVAYAYKEQLTKGVSDTEFASDRKVQPCEYLTFVLRSLGYIEGVDFTWDKAAEKTDVIGLTHGEYPDLLSETEKFYRGYIVLISKDALAVKTKDGKKTLSEVATGKTLEELNKKETEKEKPSGGGGGGGGGGGYVPYTPPHVHQYVLNGDKITCIDNDDTLYANDSFVAFVDNSGNLFHHAKFATDANHGLEVVTNIATYSGLLAASTVCMNVSCSELTINAPNDTIVLYGHIGALRLLDAKKIILNAEIQDLQYINAPSHIVYFVTGSIATTTDLNTASGTDLPVASNTDLHILSIDTENTTVDATAKKVSIAYKCSECAFNTKEDYTYTVSADKSVFKTNNTLFIAESTVAGGSAKIDLGLKKSAQNVVYFWYKVDSAGKRTFVECNNTGVLQTPPESSKGFTYYICDAYLYSGTTAICYTSNKITVAYTGLPTLYIQTATPQGSVNRDTYVNLTQFKLVDTHGHVTDSTNTQGEKIKGRGNTSWSFPKKGYNIKFEKKTSILEMPEAKKWSIVSNYLDKSQMRNMLASYLGNQIFIESENPEWKPSYRYTDVIWNGEYRGIYTIVESIQVNKSRINIKDISEQFDKTAQLQSYTGDGSDLNTLISDKVFNVSNAGFVLEVDCRKDATHVFTSSLGLPMCLKDPDFDDMTNSQSQLAIAFMKSKINAFESFLTSKYKTATLEEWENYIDVDSFVNWFLVEDFTKSVDANFWTSVYLYYNPTDGLIHMGPDWDFDRCIGSEGRDGNANGYYITGHQGSWPSWYQYLMQNTAFKSAVAAKWNANKDGLLGNIQTFMQSKKDEISTAIILDSKLWNRLGTNDNAIVQNLTAEINSMLSWMQNRINWYNNEFDGK